MHEFRDGTRQQKTYFIEFYDIGGNISHRKIAKMFYNGVDGLFIYKLIFLKKSISIFFKGIILVHDLTNRKSEENLKYWLNEILEENESISVFGSSDL